ncbi:transposase [Streptomyces sp. NPDC060064]|uniref:transposase n=1 Tax=Streptomyces sp. NPDC060064 TaxID=3347049 RepID=UPI0036D05526
MCTSNEESSTSGGLLTAGWGGSRPDSGSFAHYSGAVMTKRVPCPPAPGPLEAYAARFDDLFSTLAQRRGFREYLAGLLLPRDRNKTLTCLAGTEPVVGAQHAAVQRLQFFLSESTWDLEKVNARRVELLLADPATAPHAGGVLVIDRRFRRPQGRHCHRPRGQAVPGLGREDRPRRCHGDDLLGRRARLLPAARRPLHPRSPLPEREERRRLPHETADRGRSGP